jgi:clan AA aspartic protease (TIGR02281 family)
MSAPTVRSEPPAKEAGDVVAREKEQGTEPVVQKEILEQTTQLVLEPNDNGSYYVTGSINGESVLFLLDTGATWISIPERLRWKLALQRGRYVKVATAGGVVGNYETRVDTLDMGPFHFEDVAATLNPYAPNDVVLLGMSALKDVQFTQAGGQLVLSRQRAEDGMASPAPSPAQAPALVIRRSVRDCMGPSHLLNSETLKCIEGR